MLSLRFAARSLTSMRTLQCQRHVQTQPRHTLTFRSFSTTPRRLVEGVPDEFIDAIRDTALFEKLADRPSALKALSDMYTLTKDLGLDINSTTNLPSQTQMFKLAMNRKFVRAAKAVRDELLAAGFKTDSDDALLDILSLTKELKQKSKKDD